MAHSSPKNGSTAIHTHIIKMQKAVRVCENCCAFKGCKSLSSHRSCGKENHQMRSKRRWRQGIDLRLPTTRTAMFSWRPPCSWHFSTLITHHQTPTYTEKLVTLIVTQWEHLPTRPADYFPRPTSTYNTHHAIGPICVGSILTRTSIIQAWQFCTINLPYILYHLIYESQPPPPPHLTPFVTCLFR